MLRPAPLICCGRVTNTIGNERRFITTPLEFSISPAPSSIILPRRYLCGPEEMVGLDEMVDLKEIVDRSNSRPRGNGWPESNGRP